MSRFSIGTINFCISDTDDEEKFTVSNTSSEVLVLDFTLLYIVFRMAQSEPSSGVKGKTIYNKNLSN